MKKIEKYLWIICLFCLCISCSRDEEDQNKGLFYSRTIDHLRYSLMNGEVSVILTDPNVEEVHILPYVKLGNYEYPVSRILSNGFTNSKIKKIYIPATINVIGMNAFRNTKLEELYLDDLFSWNNVEFEMEYGLDVPDIGFAFPMQSGTKLFVANKEVRRLVIPDRIKKIDGHKFRCFAIDTIDLPYRISSIGGEAFAFSNVKVLINDFVQEISSDAFYQSDSLKTLIFKSGFSFPSISCKYPETIDTVCAPSLDAWTDFDFKYLNSDGSPTFRSLPKSYILKLGGEIAKDIYYDMYGIGSLAFSGSNIKTFKGSRKFYYVKFEAFSYCSELEEIYLPAAMTILECSFTGCDKLKKIELGAPQPPTQGIEIEKWGIKLDKNVARNCVLYVPRESVDLYRNHPYWGDFQNIVGKDF